MKIAAHLLAAAVLMGASTVAHAQLAVSANDGKQLRPGDPPSARTADSISVIDLRRYPPKVLGSVAAPASMIGAPSAVAVARNASFAIVTAGQRLNAAGSLELAGVVSVVDLAQPSAPKILQTLEVSPGAAGVTINRAGTLALVASNSNDTISVFTVAGKKLTPAGKVQLPAGYHPTDVVFAPDAKSAMVVGQGVGKLVRLDVKGSQVTVSDTAVTTGVQPYGAVYSPDGRVAYNTNLGGRPRPEGAPKPAPGGPPVVGTITAVDLATKAVNSIDVGVTPEHVARSNDGKYLAVVVANGSAAAPTAPGYHPYGLLQVYRVRGTQVTRVAEAHSGGWCQGAIFSDDGRTVLLQCALGKDIEVYRFDGKALTRDDAATLKFDARPGSIATAGSR
ncbi:YncE family protein [Phenylobacterium hankyongense]|uniref:YncE family protein n=1 Tax=Phenylobacterium hankyongense TaxID=1813876 RepID=A0A328B395_9CAUL|nr:YncE family protein [Phenylobacterium hankyongense]RAK60396.1 YncE family protein [Phenylobacterium hankyongense]